MWCSEAAAAAAANQQCPAVCCSGLLKGLCCDAQVCDDSTREDVRRSIDAKVSEMWHRGHNCLVTRRDANKGFKVCAPWHSQLALQLLLVGYPAIMTRPCPYTTFKTSTLLSSAVWAAPWYTMKGLGLWQRSVSG